MSRIELELSDTTKTTKKKSVNVSCRDTGSKRKWTKNCPECGGEQTYSGYSAHHTAIKKNQMCKSCSMILNPRGYCKTSHWSGKHLSEEHKKKISESEKGKVESNETKRKKRLAHIKRIEARGVQIYPNYNPKACKLIDEYGEKHGYTFQHALNGGEVFIEDLGYWVDGYDTEKNVVIEIYESDHKNIKRQEKDQLRKREISEHLNCGFIELWI